MPKLNLCLAMMVAGLVAAAPAAVAQDRAALGPALDDFVQMAMTRVEAVPGLAIAVVDRQGLIHAAGFGVADIETGAPVTVDTPFYIASATKPFTALAIALMDQRGQLDLDAPLAAWSVGSGIPQEVAETVTLGDLLSHQSGVRNEPIAFRVAFSGDWTPDVLWRLTSETIPNEAAPHGRFMYTNAGYNLATVLLEQRWGRDWRALVEEDVLFPLGMTRTTARIDAQRAAGTPISAGHSGDQPGQARRSPLQKVDATMQSAGGLMSSASDMALWLEAQINDGVVGGRRVLPAGLIAATHVPRVALDSRSGPYMREGYGLGWYTGRYGEDLLVHHFGGFSGSRAHVSLMPDRGLGVVVMVNEDLVAGELADVVANYVYDWLGGLPDVDAVHAARVDALVETRDARRTRLAAGLEERSGRARTLSLPDTAYAGDYHSSALGRLTVRARPEGLAFAIGQLHAVAGHGAQSETVRVELVPFQGMVAEFEVRDGVPVAVSLAGARFVRE
ncbi:MAG TPA: serine hydrolase [Brevundimonas sp.]|jgi:CubicO group peptidase (beta-lactamase class C family)|uniref:serine hydrolase domain-containing protein n=1 Tax=Brevundimonas sp. TaxID=1871086 RepID=UPI002E0DEF22|nr:serine hydrolase [Brevundimonas sp.]